MPQILGEPALSFVQEGGLEVFPSDTNLDTPFRIQNFAFLDGLPATAVISKVQLEFTATLVSGSACLIYGDVAIDREVVVRKAGLTPLVTTGLAVPVVVNITSTREDGRAWVREDLLSGVVSVLMMIRTTGLDSFVSITVCRLRVDYNEFGFGKAELTMQTTAQIVPVRPYTPPRYQVELRTGGLPDKFETLAVIDDYEELTFTKRWNQPGEWSLTIAADHPDATLLRTRLAVLRVLRNGQEEFAGLTYKPSFRQPREGRGAARWTISGTDMSGLMRRRAIVLPAGLDSDTRTGKAGVVIKDYVNANFITPTLADRGKFLAATNLSNVAIGQISQAGDDITFVGTNQMLGDAVPQMAADGGVGVLWRLDIPNGHAVLHVPPGVDRSYPNGAGGGVLLSFDSDELLSLEYEDDGLNVTNALLVGGDGTGANRVTRTVLYQPSVDRWNRQEGYYDYRFGGGTTATLDAAGAARLAQRAQSERMALEIRESEGLRYLTHWDIGDVVSIAISEEDILVDLQVIAVSTTLRGGEPPVLGIELGIPKPSILRNLLELRRDLFAATQFYPPEWIATKTASGAAKFTLTDADFVVPPRVGSVAYALDTSTGDLRIGIRKTGGVWQMSEPLNRTQQAAEITGAGKRTVADGDFSVVPPVGTALTVRDTTTGETRTALKRATGWITSAPHGDPQSPQTITVTGAGRTNAADTDFASGNPPDGSMAIVHNGTDGVVRFCVKRAGVWRAVVVA